METILVIGGGFAGLNLAKRLDPRKFRVILVDRNNFNTFPPLFYQVASCVLASTSICFPFRTEFKRRRNVSYHIGHVKNVDLQARTVTTSYETIAYDRLVISAGATNNYFGIEGLDRETFGIKTVAEAMHTKEEILDRMERGAICSDPDRRRELLTFLVVGGGPSGVEIAGALGEMKKYILSKEYPELKPDDIKITLVEASTKLLGAMSAHSQKKALEGLRQLMVNVRLETAMKGYENKYVTFADGHREYYETIIWTAGVKGEPIPGLPEVYIGHGNRITVDAYNRVTDSAGNIAENVYAVGDIALMITPETPHGHPQMAQPAIQQARNLARNLNRGEFARPFRYRDKGSMATIGKNRAVVDLPHFNFGGWFAWITWLFVHLMSLMGMRNKLSVLASWAWHYFYTSTQIRILFRPQKYPMRRHWGD